MARTLARAGAHVPAILMGFVLPGSEELLSATMSGKELLSEKIAWIESWEERNEVPTCLGEFGGIRHCFSGDNGGLQWVTDMLDILDERNIHSNYHTTR